MNARLASVATVTLVALTASALAPASASAHALLERTSPERGAELDGAPTEIAFYFNEPVEASFGAVRLFDSAGDQLDTGELERPDESSEAIGVPVTGDLPDGVYTATYRVVSADAHPVSGGFVFTVGEGGAGPSETVSELLEGTDAGTVTSVAFWAARWLGYIAIGLALGGLAFLLLILAPSRRALPGGGSWAEADARFTRRWRRLMLAVAAIGFGASVAAIALQGATAAGTSLWDALDSNTISDVLDTRYGTVAAIRAGAWALLALAIVVGWHRAALLPAAFLALSPALSGHASTQEPTWLLFPADVVHVAAMGLWFGGLAMLVLCLPAATRKLEPPERTRLLAGVLVRFSPLALGCVIALAVTGTTQALVYVQPLSDLFDTGFGRAVLIKALLLAVLIGFGYVNRQRLLPALREAEQRGETPGRTGVLFRRTLRGEIALIVAVLGVAAALVSYAPPSDAGQGPASGTTALGPATLDYTVDPAEVGRNEMHLYLFNSEDGSQYTDAKAFRVELELEEKDIGPLAVDLERAGPGHYVATSVPFGVQADWSVLVRMRVSRFEEVRGTFEVPIE